MNGRSTGLAHGLAPLLIAVPVAITVVTMLFRALGVDHPDLGFATATNSDAEAFSLGDTIYRDPADGYTGQIYTPLFPFLVSLLHRIHLWGGWPLLLNQAATLVLVGLAAWLAWDRTAAGRGRLLAAAGAVGMGLVAWWLVSFLPLNVLHDGRAEHTAWAFALTGLVLVCLRPDGSAKWLGGAVLLLSAAFWTKQTAGVAAAVAALWILLAALAGAVAWRRAVAFCGSLLVLNLAVLGLINLVTDGWEWVFDFELASEHPKFADYGPSFREFTKYVGAALALPAAIGAALAIRGRAWEGGRERLRALFASPDARVATGLVLFLVVAAPVSVYFRLKVGAEPNQYVGFLWGVGLLSALAWRVAGRYRPTAWVAVAAILVLFVLAQRQGETVRGGYWVGALHRTQEYVEVDPALVDFARSHLVWLQVQSDLNVEPQGSLYPNFYNFVDLLAAGRQPLYLVDAFLDRRFDAVAPIRFPAGDASEYWNLYANGAFEEEDNYFWKLNQVIAANYAAAPGLPAGLWARRRASLAPWMRDCFGPFDAAGTEFGIRRGGGFWCREGEGVLRLRRTPAAISEIHALDRVKSVSGTLALAAAGPVAISLKASDERGWTVSVRPEGADAAAVEASLDGRPLGEPVRVQLRGEPLEIEFGPGGGSLAASGGGVRVALPDIDGGDLSIGAARASGARLDLSRLETAR